MHFLLLLHKSIVLGQTLQSQFLHEVDDVWLLQPAILELLHSNREGCGVQHDLPIIRQMRDQLLNNGLKLWREQLISL